MKAAYRKKYGGPEVLTVKDIQVPEIGDDEILIEVHYSTVNRTDTGALLGKPFIYRFFVGFPNPKFKTTGTDLAGIVCKVGKNISSFSIGDKIIGFNDNSIPSHAKFISIKPTSNIIKIPPEIDLLKASASIEGLHYARVFLKNLDLQTQHKAFVNGGTGGIGSALIQLLKQKVLSIDATSPKDHIEIVKMLGVENVINYEEHDFTQSNNKYDFVFDAVGKSTFEKCRSIMKDKAVYISSELGPGSENLYLPFLTRSKDHKVKFPLPDKIHKSLELSRDLLVSNEFEPLIDRVYKLDDIQEAFTYVLSGKKIGNVVLDIINS